MIYESFLEDEWDWQVGRWHERFLPEETAVDWTEVYLSLKADSPYHGDCPF